MPRGAAPTSIRNPLVTHDVFHTLDTYPRWLDDIVTGAVRAVASDMNTDNPHPVRVSACMRALTTLPTLDRNTIRTSLRRPGFSPSEPQVTRYLRVLKAAVPHIERHIAKERGL